MYIPKLDERLSAAKNFVKRGGIVVDIGTDHAYLPIVLLHEGMCDMAIATDINEGPLERARKNISLAGLSDRVKILKADGLKDLESYYPDTVLILGMGGELIEKILSDADWLKKRRGVRLVLQPMTHPECVRRYLAENGYFTVDEKICKSGKYYCVIAAEYDGMARVYSDVELLFGSVNMTRRDDMTLGYAAELCKVFETRAAGLKRGGEDAAFEETVINKLKRIIRKE